MKKIIAALLVLVMALSLCACDSSDYKEAMELYNLGDYAQARTMFVALADYEDSADMVNKCDYQMAQDYMIDGKYEEAKALFVQLGDYEDSAARAKDCSYNIAKASMSAGEYQKARELFIELGDYEDSAAIVVIAAQNMFIAYVEQQGQLVEKSSDNSNGTVLHAENGELVVAYAYKTTGIIAIDMKIGAVMQPGDKQVLLVGTDELSTYAAYYTATASGTWDIENYTKGGKMAWEDFDISGRTAQGTAYEQKNSWLDLFLTTGVGDIAEHIEKALGESGLGLTMKDIGFTNY